MPTQALITHAQCQQHIPSSVSFSSSALYVQLKLPQIQHARPFVTMIHHTTLPSMAPRVLHLQTWHVRIGSSMGRIPPQWVGSGRVVFPVKVRATNMTIKGLKVISHGSYVGFPFHVFKALFALHPVLFVGCSAKCIKSTYNLASLINRQYPCHSELVHLRLPIEYKHNLGTGAMCIYLLWLRRSVSSCPNRYYCQCHKRHQQPIFVLRC